MAQAGGTNPEGLDKALASVEKIVSERVQSYMLVISQKEGEKLVLSSGITISILEVKSGKVRLGIEAPKDVEIRRVPQKENTSDKSHK